MTNWFNIKLKTGMSNSSFMMVMLVLFMEFFNSMLRYFFVIDMELGVLIRKALFLLLLFLMLLRVFKRGRNYDLRIDVKKEYLSFVLMYIYFIMVYLFNRGGADLSEISNIIIPFVVAVLGYSSLMPNRVLGLRLYIAGYLSVLCLMYLINVRYGAFNYTPVGLNSIYYIILAFPVVFLERNKRIRMLFSIPIVVMGIVSLKTTAVLIILACLLAYYLFGARHFGLKLFLLPVFGVFLVLIISYVAQRYFSMDVFEIYYRQNVTDGGNGRLEIWKSVLDEFSKSSFHFQLFGHGYNNGFDFVFGEAHCDFLETLYDYGLIGLVLLLVNFTRLIHYGVKMYKGKYKYTGVYFMLLTEIFIMFVFSNSLFVASYILIVVCTLFMLLRDYDEGQTMERLFLK